MNLTVLATTHIKAVSFDCYGTLTNFRIGETTARLLGNRISADKMSEFLADYTAYRFDEVLGDWQPYAQVLSRSLERACNRWGIPFEESDADAIVAAVPTWGPHPDVPEPLAKLAEHFPLVILSNASDSQIHANVEKLGAPFAHVLTAEQARAYKPRFKAFEYMFDTVGHGPECFLHISSSLRYDLISAHDLRIGTRVLVDRGHGPGIRDYGYHEADDLGGLPALLGLA